MNEHQVVIDRLTSLAADLRSHPEEWENVNLVAYLEALAAWLGDWQAKHNEPLTWDFVANMFEAGKYYE